MKAYVNVTETLRMIAVALLVLILVLLTSTPWRHRPRAGQLSAAAAEIGSASVGPLILVGLPAVFYTFFWVVGPLY